MTARRSFEEAPVVIVGAGPVGLAAALGFAARGIPTIVFESGPVDTQPEWRGSTIHPPTLEILDALGLADDALRRGVRVDTIQYRDLELDDVVEMHYAVLAGRTRFPFRLQYDQYKLLRALRDAAEAASDVDVRYEHAVVGVEPGDELTPATVVVRTTDGATTRVSARWVVAADGSHSAVRAALAVAMSGDTYETLSLVVATDTDFFGLLPGLAPVSYWSGPRGRMSLIRTPDTWRVALTTGDASAGIGHHLVSESTGLHPAFVDVMSHIAGERDWTHIRQHQLYRSHQRFAETFHVERVLLAGDAAHLSATTGGMGLNSGVHDAHELVGALAPAILTGTGDYRAAASVAARRRRIAEQFVQPATRTARAALDLTDEAARRRRLRSLQQIASDEERMTAHLVAASMLDVVDVGQVLSQGQPGDDNRCR
jgi:3-(3-hydroxy-phenyl)propionate hydroxylase